MPRTCSLCAHPERSNIEKGLASATGSIRTIAYQFGVTRDAAMRHKARHMSAALATAVRKRELEAGDLLSRIEASYAKAEALYNVAEGILQQSPERS